MWFHREFQQSEENLLQAEMPRYARNWYPEATAAPEKEFCRERKYSQ
jgi:hypothetical protein